LIAGVKSRAIRAEVKNMSPLSSQFELRQRKAIEQREAERQRERKITERHGLEEARAHYWELLEEFFTRAQELGLQPRRHQSDSNRGTNTRVEWVEGFRLRNGSIVTAPPLRYSLIERRLVGRSRSEVLEVEETTLFVLSSDAGLSVGLSEPKTASQGGWPAVDRWDRAVNILLALEAELEANLLELMDSAEPEPDHLDAVAYVASPGVARAETSEV
jgi:hypothetical protein